jgi:hypothetical protein
MVAGAAAESARLTAAAEAAKKKAAEAAGETYVAPTPAKEPKIGKGTARKIAGRAAADQAKLAADAKERVDSAPKVRTFADLSPDEQNERRAKEAKSKELDEARKKLARRTRIQTRLNRDRVSKGIPEVDYELRDKSRAAGLNDDGTPKGETTRTQKALRRVNPPKRKG